MKLTFSGPLENTLTPIYRKNITFQLFFFFYFHTAFSPHPTDFFFSSFAEYPLTFLLIMISTNFSQLFQCNQTKHYPVRYSLFFKGLVMVSLSQEARSLSLFEVQAQSATHQQSNPIPNDPNICSTQSLF